MNFGLSQLTFLCVVNDKGKLPTFSANRAGACILVGSVMELATLGYIEIDKKRVWATGVALHHDHSHLRPLLNIIVSSRKPMSFSSLSGKYLNTFTGRNLNDLMMSVGYSLLPIQGVSEVRGRKPLFAPTPSAQRWVASKIRDSFCVSKCIVSTSICNDFVLAAILDKGGFLKQMFAKAEYQQIRHNIKWLREEVKRNPEFVALRKTFEFLDICFILFIAIISSSAGAAAASGC